MENPNIQRRAIAAQRKIEQQRFRRRMVEFLARVL